MLCKLEKTTEWGGGGGAEMTMSACGKKFSWLGERQGNVTDSGVWISEVGLCVLAGESYGCGMGEQREKNLRRF